MSEPTSNLPNTTTSSDASSTSSERRTPRVSLAVATAFGLGYLPQAPGTFGSLAGVALYAVIQYFFPLDYAPGARPNIQTDAFWLALTALPVTIVLALGGVWAASRAAEFSAKKDPQFVVIDEVSGQHLTYFLSLTLLNWKYLLLGFILFRVFDIWKPFPARQAESLPGGLGIMADDWIAGIYAALGLWIARAIGL
ncbi:MAG TPA: phosphatidylglycerophosphatase A [Candidatus Acidoferrales bacterium]|jgi:phosphatidylglycerophosphatase A|nr:phosphatidylglycerophosphatase A [Candidatus Acidoferrales bacterium]